MRISRRKSSSLAYYRGAELMSRGRFILRIALLILAISVWMAAAVALVMFQVPNWWKWAVVGGLLLFLPVDLPELTYRKYVEQWEADNRDGGNGLI
jgi:hypothetical protein